MNLADNLKKIRKDNNLSQEQFAEKLNVSRQSVSKWESGQSYPEMDKVIQICNLFNLNINELINENINEVNERKESQNRTNKYISSFFDYITKVVEMLSSMKFGQIVKCLLEQVIVFCILASIFMIFGMIGSELFDSLFSILPQNIYWSLFNIIKTIYLIIIFIVGIVVFLHIFKIRYLDYYEIVKEDNIDNIDEVVVDNIVEEQEADNKKTKIVLEKKKEKVVIRDPKHSDYNFFTGIGKCILLGIKSLVFLVMCCFVISFICFILCLPIITLVMKNIMLFVGLLIGLFGCITFNYVILELLYNFIFNRKDNKNKVLLLSIISFIAVGLGLGFTITSCVNFKVEEKYYEKTSTEFILDMKDNVRIECFGYWIDAYEESINYVVEDRDDLRIVVKHPIVDSVDIIESTSAYFINFDDDYNQIMNYIRDIIKGINNSKIYDYKVDYEVTIYGSSDNLKKLKSNYSKYYDELNNLTETNNELRNENNGLINENVRLNYNNYALVNELNKMGYKVHYDESKYYSYIEKEE